MNYTAIIEKSEDGFYVGQVQEIPEAIAQGITIDELKQNLLDALQLVTLITVKDLQLAAILNFLI